MARAGNSWASNACWLALALPGLLALATCRFDTSGVRVSGLDAGGQGVVDAAGDQSQPQPDVDLPFDAPPDLPDEKSDLAISDLAISDLASPDQTISDQTIPDQTISDQTIPDLAIPDLAIPDMAIADLAIPDLSAENICDALYGAADSYFFCSATATSCTFFARTNGGDCATLCSTVAQGTCITAVDANPWDKCTPVGTPDCNKTFTDQLCTCSR